VERLGVLLGHRRKLLRAIAALGGAPAPVIEPAPTPLPAAAGQTSSATSPISTAAGTAGERRHVTVLFCDLVDSTGIAARLDAEDGATWSEVTSKPLRRL
jgi:class 3 adenylate cyclase